MAFRRRKRCVFLFVVQAGLVKITMMKTSKGAKLIADTSCMKLQSKREFSMKFHKEILLS